MAKATVPESGTLYLRDVPRDVLASLDTQRRMEAARDPLRRPVSRQLMALGLICEALKARVTPTEESQADVRAGTGAYSR